MTERPSTTARGYGNNHQKLRERWRRQVERGEVRCARCGRFIQPGQAWDLDHDDLDRSQYLGPSHQACNRAAARRRAAARNGALYMPVYRPAGRHVPRKRSEDW
jgi:hypothetical protein